MSSLPTNLDYTQQGMLFAGAVANAYFDASSPSTVYGRRASTTSRIQWGYYGGMVSIGGVPTVIANGTLTLTDVDGSVYVEANQLTGAVTQNNTGWTPGRTPLYLLVLTTVSGFRSVTSYTDMRLMTQPVCPMFTMPITVSAPFQYAASNSLIVVLTGTPSAAFTLTIPARPWVYTIKNKTGQDATFKTASAATVVVAAGKTAQIMTDGTDASRVSADV